MKPPETMKKGSFSNSWGSILLWGLSILGIALIVYRFVFGLGAITNLSDGYPWGLWIGIDVLAGIALASGGFVMAGTVHLFGGRKFHPLVRPAIFTAFLGYILFMIGLIVDLGRPWNILKVVFYWNQASPLFEVSWCVVMYTFVLVLEFLPAVFERFHLKKAHESWRSMSPWLIIVMLSLFIHAMTSSWIWTIALAVIFLIWEICMRIGIMPRDAQMPVVLIVTGVIFSSLHQSSLGALYLMVPHKLNLLWYTPLLPVLFFFSSIMVAPAMVTFEALTTEKLLDREVKFPLLYSLVRGMPFLLGIYLVIKIADLIHRGVIPEVLDWNVHAASWWLEISIGVILPMALYMSHYFIARPVGLYIASTLVIVGLVWNRINVSIVGMDVDPKWGVYFPHWGEIFITIGVFAMGLLIFKWVLQNLPIHEGHFYQTES
jgi:formate dehydrogenase iron-sulfur subunit